MRWPHWYPTRADILGILFVLVVICVFVFAVTGSNHRATGFGPDWDCQVMPKGDPVCIKKPLGAHRP
jgi:hypothetical protein